jgi:hypothetical protein
VRLALSSTGGRERPIWSTARSPHATYLVNGTIAALERDHPVFSLVFVIFDKGL